MRRLALVAGLLLSAVVLSGCVGVLTDPYRNVESDGGQSSSELLTGVEALPGIASTEFSLQPWDNPGEGGLFSSSGMNFVLEVAIDAEHHVADPAEFLETAFAAAWQVNDGFSPQGRVFVVLNGGVDPDFDWDAVLRDHFGTQHATRDVDGANVHAAAGDEIALGERMLVGLSTDLLAARFGAWPAEPAAWPSGLVAAGAPPAVDPVPVAGFRVAGVMSDEDCWSFSFVRNVDSESGAAYAGDVEVTLRVRGEIEGTQVARGADVDPEYARDGVSFCYEDRRPGDFQTVTFDVVAPPEPGFTGLDIEGIQSR